MPRTSIIHHSAEEKKNKKKKPVTGVNTAGVPAPQAELTGFYLGQGTHFPSSTIFFFLSFFNSNLNPAPKQEFGHQNPTFKRNP